jgi:hypothetical protein
MRFLHSHQYSCSSGGTREIHLNLVTKTDQKITLV